MSRGAEVELEFGGQLCCFRLAIGELRKLQEKCDAGPGEIAARLAPFLLYGQEKRIAREAGVREPSLIEAAAAGRLGTWRIDDVRETLLQGLIGGGLDPNAAGQMIRAYVDERPKLESVQTAFLVVMAAIAGVDDEDAAGERSGTAGAPSSPSPKGNSASA